MCYCDGDPATVITEQDRKAIGWYFCSECGMPISSGDSYRYIRGLFDGSWLTFRQCQKCSDLLDTFLDLGYCVPYEGLQEFYFGWLEENGLIQCNQDGKIVAPINHLICEDGCRRNRNV